MCHSVIVEIGTGRKPFTAHAALVRFFAAVDSPVGVQRARRRETLVTHGANVRLFAYYNKYKTMHEEIYIFFPPVVIIILFRTIVKKKKKTLCRAFKYNNIIKRGNVCLFVCRAVVFDIVRTTEHLTFYTIFADHSRKIKQYSYDVFHIFGNNILNSYTNQ